MLSTRTIYPASIICRNLLFNNSKYSKCFQIKSPIIVSKLFKSSKVDGSSDSLIKIYHGSLATRMKAVKVFSLTTSLTGLIAQPILMEAGTKLGGTALAVGMCSFVGFFTFITPVLLHFITKKYVTEIQYNPTNYEYKATTISLFLQKIETTFKVSDVVVPEVPGMFTSVVVKNKPLFLEPSQFTDPNHYVKIMGYDKPMDFKLNLTKKDVNESRKKS